MGQSTDACLIFGIDLGEFLPEFLEEYEDPSDYIDDQIGIPPFGDPGSPDYVDRVEMREGFPVIFEIHCSFECPMYIVGVPGTNKTARRGYPENVESLDVDKEKVAAFNAWCAENGIEGTPTWLLYSMWG